MTLLKGMIWVFRKLLGDSLIYFLSAVVVQLVPFALMPLLTEKLGTSGYGVVTTFMTYATIFSLVLGMGFPAAISVIYAKRGKHVLKKAATFMVIASTLFFLVLLLLDLLFSEPISTLLLLSRLEVLICIVFSFAQFWVTMFLVLVQMARRPLVYFSIQGFLAVANLLLTLLTVGFFQMGVLGRIVSLVTPTFLVFFFCVVLFFVSGSWSPSKKYGRVSGYVFKLGLPLVPHGLAGWLLSGIDRILISNISGMSPVGLYSVGSQLGNSVGVIYNAFNNAWAPFFLGQMKESEKTGHKKIFLLSLVSVVLLVIGGLIVFGLMDIAVDLLANEKFSAAKDIARVFVISSMFYGISLIGVNYLYYFEKTVVIPTITFSAGLLNVGLSFFLIQKIGFSGAAFANLASNLVTAILIWSMASFYLRKKKKNNTGLP